MKTNPSAPSVYEVQDQPAAPESTLKMPRSLSRQTRSRIMLGLLGILVLNLLCAATIFGLYVYYASGLAAADQLGSVQLPQSTKIYDRNGGLIFEVLDPQSGRRTVVKPDQIPLVLKQATVATEDQSFYWNPGVDPVGVARAIYQLLKYGHVVSGGSTITQQLVKNAILSPDPTIERKVHEAALALEVTRRYSKDQILTMYLNTIFYGNLAYGIEAATQTYFDKDVSQIDLAEASLLAGLPQAPALFDPCDDADAALARQRTVLELMMKSGYINETQANKAHQEMSERLNSTDFDKRCTTETALKYPHFVNYVRAQLERQFGPEVVYKGGLEVTTTLDPQMQAIVEDEARRQIDVLRGKNVGNAAVVMIDPHTGEILAMLGSVNFSDKGIAGQVNMADVPRQPGSSIKPINYVTAFTRGWTPATPIYDLKTNFPDGNSKPPYAPTDYDGKEHGLVSARTALANSLNIPAVKTLYETSTKDENNFPQPLAMLETARKLGITTLTDENGNPRQTYGLALTLGGGAVKLTELTAAYAVFANQGTRVPATPFLRIVDGKGQVLVDSARDLAKQKQCAGLDPNARDEAPDANGLCSKSASFAYLITDILSDNQARSMEFGAHSPLELSRPAAAKTGTTNDFRDNWTIGYTPDLVVGVWVGNANNHPMHGVSGISGAAPIWHSVMERALTGVPARDFPVPPGIVRAEVCTDSGLLATDLCPKSHQRVEIFAAGYAPTQTDNVWEQLACGNRSGLYQAPPHDVGDLIAYPQIRQWARAHGWNVPPNQNSCSDDAAAAQNHASTIQNNNHGKQEKKKHGHR